MDIQSWVDKLVDVRRFPEKYQQSTDDRVTPWSTATWQMLTELREDMFKRLPASSNGHRDDVVIKLYREYGDILEQVRLGVIERCAMTHNESANMFPLVPGGLLFPELVALEMNLKNPKVSLGTLWEAIHYIKRIGCALKWELPHFERMFNRIIESIRIKDMTARS